MNEKFLEFNNLRSKVADMIEDISNHGFNTEKYTHSLSNIDVAMKNLSNRKWKTRFTMMDFSTIMGNLKELEKELLKYDTYIKASNITDYVNDQLNRKSEVTNSINKNKDDMIVKIFDVNHVDDLVNKIIDILNQIKSLNSVNVDKIGKEATIVKEIYNTAYELIKLEVATKYESKLYDYILASQYDLSCVNKCFYDEINKLDLTSNRYIKLHKKLFELDSRGLGNDYFDIESIKLLLDCDDRYNIESSISSKLDTISKSINSFNNEFSQNMNILTDTKKKVLEGRSQLRRTRRGRFKSIISLILSFSILGGVGYGVFRLSKYLANSDCYKKTVTTYSDYNGLNVSDDYVIANSISSSPNTIYLREYGVWEDTIGGDYKREIKVYDVSDFDFENIEDYVNYGLDNYGVSFEKEKDTTADAIKIYSDPYIEVEKTYVDTSNVEVVYEKDIFILSCVLFYMVYFALFMMVCGISQGQFVFGNIDDIFEYFKECKNLKVNNIKNLEKIKSTILKLQDVINSDEKLRVEFNKLYEENKYLLNDPEELYRRFDELCISMDMPIEKVNNRQIKKLVKKEEKTVSGGDIDW